MKQYCVVRELLPMGRGSHVNNWETVSKILSYDGKYNLHCPCPGMVIYPTALVGPSYI